MDIQKTIDDFTPPINELIEKLPDFLPPENLELLNVEVKSLIEKSVPEALANRIACCATLFTSLDIVEATRQSHFSLDEVARTYYIIGNRLDLVWLRESIGNFPTETQWGELGRSSFRDDLDRVQRNLSVHVLLLTKKKMKKATINERIDEWLGEHLLFFDRWKSLVADIKATASLEFVTYSVLLRELFDFIEVSEMSGSL